MVKLTKSLQHFLWLKYRELIVPIMFGHTELFTDKIQAEYVEWLKTEEAKDFLEVENEKSNIN